MFPIGFTYLEIVVTADATALLVGSQKLFVVLCNQLIVGLQALFYSANVTPNCACNWQWVAQEVR